MRESFIFYKTFYDCIKELPQENGYTLYNAIFEYVFCGEEPELFGLEKGIFALMKAQIDANNRKYENGKQGGRPKNENQNGINGFEKAHENENQNETSGFEKVDEKKNQNKTNGFEKAHENENQNETGGFEKVPEKKNRNKTNGFEKAHENENQNKTKTKPNVNDNDNENVNDNGNVNVSGSENTSRKTRCTRFDDFWKYYPRKMDMLNAQGEYAYLLETTESLSEEDLLAAAQNYARTCHIRNTKEQYIKSPVNWLKESSWLDYLSQNYKEPESGRTKRKCSSTEKPVVKSTSLSDPEEELLSEEELAGDDWMKYGPGWRDRDVSI